MDSALAGASGSQARSTCASVVPIPLNNYFLSDVREIQTARPTRKIPQRDDLIARSRQRNLNTVKPQSKEEELE